MFKFLMPKGTDFFAFFIEHCKLTAKAAKELVDLAESGTDIPERASRIRHLENKTDALTHICIKELQKTFITPFDRSHIQELICALDDVMDSIDEAASRIELYEVTEIRPETTDLARLIFASVQHIGAALSHLHDMKNDKAIKKACITIHKLENEADRALRTATLRLFHEEGSPFLVMKWKEIFEILEATTDHCEDVADIIRGILIESS